MDIELAEQDIFSDRSLAGAIEQQVDTEESVLHREGRRVLYRYNGRVFFTQGSLTMEDGIPVGWLFTLDMTNFTLDNGSERPLQDLKSDNFFDVENYPEATISFTDIQETENPNEFVITAYLTIKDITNDISFVASFTPDRLHAVAAFEIDRTRWDIQYGSNSFFDNLGDRAIDNMIGFSVEVVFVE